MMNTVQLLRRHWPALIALATLALIALGGSGHAMDHGFNPDDRATKWFESLMIPPAEVQSCCGKADAYPVDDYEPQPNGDMLVTIADGSAFIYPDGTQRKPWDTSVKVLVPAAKVNKPKDDLTNPTDHGWLFFVPQTSYPADGSEPQPAKTYAEIYCYIPHPRGF